MDEFGYDSSTTMVMLYSPQYLAENIDFRNTLLPCRDHKVLCLIAVNEAHIYAMQRSTFHEPSKLLDATSSLDYMADLTDFHP